jgi:iron complex outermembrane recepter protein
MKRTSRVLPILIGATGLAAAPICAGQETAATGASALEEVIVTAQFRRENLQETPLSITAVTGERLEEQGLTNVAELGLVIPNANFRQNPFNGPNPSIGMRGVNTTEFIYTTEPGVAVYVDDVYHGTLTGSAMDLLDLERVEVLRGPQGTLFGKNALGGAIRLISKQPQGSDTGYVEATYGSSRRMEVKAGFDFALRDDLFMRVTGVSKSIDGYQDTLDFACQMVVNGTPQLAGTLPSEAPSNAVTDGNCKTGENGGSENEAVKAMVRWLATEDLELNFSIDYSKTNAQAGAQTLLSGAQSAGLDALYNDLVIQPRFGVRYDDNRFVPRDVFTTYQSWRDPVKNYNWPRDQVTDTWSSSGKLDYDIGEVAHLKLVVAHRAYDSNWAGPNLVPLGGATLNLQKHRQDSAELQLSGALFDKRVEWTVGAFYFDSESELGGYVDFGALDFFGVIPSFDQNDHFTTKSKSGFAHLVWTVTDALSLTTGVRQTSEDKTFAFDHTGYLTVATPLEYGSSHFDWKVAVDYKLTDTVMLYGMASTGFRSDGAQPRPWAPNQLLSVPMEEITAYELGAKTDFFDRRLRVNASVFVNDYDPRVTSRFGQSCSPTAPDPGPYVPFGTPVCPAGTQLAGQPPGNGVFWFQYFSAPGKAKGAELEITAVPVDNLTMNASAGFYEYDSDVSPGVDGYVHPSVREQPRFSYSAGAQYAINMRDGGAFTPRIDVFYQGERTNGGSIGAPQRDPYNIIPDYTLVSARLTYSSGDGKWIAALSAENLFDEFYWNQLGAERTNVGDAPVFSRTGSPGRGREYAFTLRRNFQ